MPGKLSLWIDICIAMTASALLLVIMIQYDWYIAAGGIMLWICLFLYLKERSRERRRALWDYYENVIKNVNELSNYALENLPQVIMVIDKEMRLKWYNHELERWLAHPPEIDSFITEMWPSLPADNIWGRNGKCIFSQDDKFYMVTHRPVISESATASDEPELMALYIYDVTAYERFKLETATRMPVFGYIQIDNYDDVMQGLSEAQRTSILFEVNSLLDKWAHGLGAMLRRVSDDMYIILMERHSLDLAIREKFDVLDKVRKLHGDNKFPITLSIGLIQSRPNTTMEQLGAAAQSHLDLVLGRGGDQVAVDLDGKVQFFGGKTKAVEKHTRVKARVVAHAIYERMETADVIFVMGHHNEDFDSLGSAIGVACMARQMKKPVYIILSDMNEGVEKLINLSRTEKNFENLYITPKEALNMPANNPLLFVVDTHIPYLVAGPELLESINNVIVIDHHRRSEKAIKNALLIYIESYSSSTSELVTELLMYFNDAIKISRLEATALYAGIVVDTKNFRINTGVRTFDAVAFLRRCGADPEVVHYLFRTDYETNLAEGTAIANSHLYPGGLLVAVCPDNTANIQAVSGKIADDLLQIENIRATIVFFKLKENLIGVSARSSGEINVQLIMEQFGGGGHQNVAGTQVKDCVLSELRNKVVQAALKQMKEVDHSESNNDTGSKKSGK